MNLRLTIRRPIQWNILSFPPKTTQKNKRKKEKRGKKKKEEEETGRLSPHQI